MSFSYLDDDLANVWQDENDSAPKEISDAALQTIPTNVEPATDLTTILVKETIEIPTEPMEYLEEPTAKMENEPTLLKMENKVQQEATQVWDPLNHGTDKREIFVIERNDDVVMDLINPFNALQTLENYVQPGIEESLYTTPDIGNQNQSLIQTQLPISQKIESVIIDPLSVDQTEGTDLEEEIESKSNKAQFYFNVAVLEPIKVGDTLSAHVTYKVKTITDSVEYRNKEVTVNRRFRDFLWLYNNLVNKYPGLIIPPVPEKLSIGNLLKLKKKGDFRMIL